MTGKPEQRRGAARWLPPLLLDSARTPHRIRSRSGGAFRFINYGIRPIGALLGGTLGATFGVRETLFVVTIAATAGVLWLIRSPVLRLRDLPDTPE